MSLLLALTAAGGGDAVFVGTTSLTFSQTGALAANTAPAGTTTLTFAQTGALNAFSSLSGTATAVFGQTGALSGGAGLNGTTTLVFGQSGDFVAGAAAGDAVFVGTATLTFGQSGAFAAQSILAGTATIVFGQSGSFIAAPAIPVDDIDWTGHDGKKRKQQHEYAYDEYAKRKRELEAVIAKAIKTVDPETDTSSEVLEAVDNAPVSVLQTISNVVLEYRKLIQLKLDEDVAIAILMLQ